MGPAPTDDTISTAPGKLNRQQRRTFKASNPDHTKSTWARQTKSEIKRKRKIGRQKLWQRST